MKKLAVFVVIVGLLLGIVAKVAMVILPLSTVICVIIAAVILGRVLL